MTGERFKNKGLVNSAGEWKEFQASLQTEDTELAYESEMTPTSYPAVVYVVVQPFTGEQVNANFDVLTIGFVYLEDFKLNAEEAKVAAKPKVKARPIKARPAFEPRKNLFAARRQRG